MAKVVEKVIWRPHPGPQTQFLSSMAREVLYGGSRGGGKTDCVLAGAVRFVHVKGYRALILRRTFPELREVMDRAQEHYPQLGGEWIASEKRWRWRNGTTVEFGYCESHADAMQYQGQEFHYIAFDEIGQLAEERTWLLLMTSLRRPPEGVVLMARATANPGGPGHGWLRKRFILPCPPDGKPVFDQQGNSRAFFQARVYDNPTLMLEDPDYVRMLESLPEVMRQQHLFGNWEVGTGLAFEALTETSHLVPKLSVPAPHWHLFGAFDWGFGHKWAFALMAMRPDGVVQVIDSVMGRRMVPEDIATRVQELLQGYGLGFNHLSYTVAGSDTKIQDGARGNWGPSVAEQFRGFGWVLINADQNRIAGYQNLLSYLHQRRVLFCDTAVNRKGIDQLMGLVVDPDSPNDVRKVDVDETTGEGGDDWYDMLRYGLMSRPLPKTLPEQPQDRINRLILARQQREDERTTTHYALPRPAHLPSANTTMREERV